MNKRVQCRNSYNSLQVCLGGRVWRVCEASRPYTCTRFAKQIMRSVQCRCRDYQFDSKIALLLLSVVSIQLATNTQVYSTTGEFLKFPRPLIHNVECQKSNVFFQLRHLTFDFRTFVYPSILPSLRRADPILRPVVLP